MSSVTAARITFVCQTNRTPAISVCSVIGSGARVAGRGLMDKSINKNDNDNVASTTYTSVAPFCHAMNSPASAGPTTLANWNPPIRHVTALLYSDDGIN